MDQQVRVPDIGGISDVEIVEILVKPGDSIGKDQSLITLESDKAAMEVPSPAAGTIKKLNVSIGDRVSEGADILVLDIVQNPELADQSIEIETVEVPEQATAQSPELPDPTTEAAPSERQPEKPVHSNHVNTGVTIPKHASPSVRRFARELGADLAGVNGTGRKGRILRDDVKARKIDLRRIIETRQTSS